MLILLTREIFFYSLLFVSLRNFGLFALLHLMENLLFAFFFVCKLIILLLTYVGSRFDGGKTDDMRKGLFHNSHDAWGRGEMFDIGLEAVEYLH